MFIGSAHLEKAIICYKADCKIWEKVVTCFFKELKNLTFTRDFYKYELRDFWYKKIHH